MAIVAWQSLPATATTELEQTASESSLSGSFLASRVAIGDNDDAAALKFLERAISLDPDNPNIQRDLYLSLVANGRVDEAAEILNNSEKVAEGDNLARMTLAVEALRKRSWATAKNSLQEIVGGDLDQLLREVSLAWVRFGEGEASLALATLDELDGADWVLAVRDYHTALVAAADNDDELAAERFQAVIDRRSALGVLTETYLRSIEMLVRLKSGQGDLEGAKRSLAFGITLIPNHPPFVALDKAISAGETPEFLAMTPQQGVAELFFNIATAIRRDGGAGFAKSYLQFANHLAPETDVVTISLAELYLQQSDFEKSNFYYDAITEASSFYRIATLERANNLARLERTDEAVEALKELIGQQPDDLTGYMTLGGLYSREKRYQEAADLYDTAVGKIGTPERQHWNLFFRRGIAYERLKLWPQAEPNFLKSLELSPDQAEVLNYLGYSWIDQGIQLERGLEMIRKAVDLRPRSGFIVDSLGWAYYRLGEFEKAVRELERAVALMPQDPTINDHLGDAYWQVGRKLEATFQWKIALAATDPKPDKPEEIRRKLVEGLEKPDTAASKQD